MTNQLRELWADEIIPLAFWDARAACADMDPAIFFPPVGRSCALARAICAGCPVKRECLDHALATGERYGVWGGTTVRERRRMRQARRQAA